MPRLRTPTGLNHYAAGQIEAAAVQRWRAAYAAALAPMIALEKRLAAGDISPETAARHAVSALRTLTAAQPRLMRLESVMLGAVLLRGGATVGEIIARTGISGSTLRRHLHPGPADLRGRECLPDSASPYGWRAL